MNTSHSVLVVYAHDGFRSALNVVKALEPVAEVQLCSYDQSQDRLPWEPDVALCIVTDDKSLDMAHEFQVRLEDVPTLVVDGSGGLKIEVNGYAGRISSSPDQVLNAVGELLAANEAKDYPPARKTESTRLPRRISSPFDHTLARAAGGSQTPESTLISAARQLSWDLRADRVEVFLRSVEKNSFQNVYAEPEFAGERACAPSAEVVRLIKKRSYPITAQDLESRPARPLYHYLNSRNLNLLMPLVKETRLLGWLAFGLEAARCTNELLDDLQVAGYLLTISVAEAYNREAECKDAKNLHDAFSALKFGILTIDHEGQITSIAGATTLLGSDPQKGDHFGSIHNSRVREVIAHALQEEFVEKSWIDFESQETISSFSNKLSDGKIVVFWGPRQSQPPAGQKQGAPTSLDLKEVLESLPVPVLLDNEVSPGTIPFPQGRITDEDGQAIRDCALQAQARKVKALRLRWGKKRSQENAVLFYETSKDEGNAEFSDDIEHAVRFSLVAA